MYTQEILDHITLHGLAEELAHKHKDKLAFCQEFDGKKVTRTYHEFLKDTEALSLALRKRYPKGHIALIMHGSVEFYLLFYSIIMSGGVVVPIDVEATDDERVREILHSDSVACFYSGRCSKKIDAVKDRLGGVDLINADESLDQLIKKGRDLEGDDFAESDPDSPAAIFYTSGTTGENKGAVLSQKAIASVACKAGCHVDVYESVLSVLPAHHTYGCINGVLSIYGLARTVYFTKNLKTFVKDLKKYEPSNLFLVPMFLQTMYKMIWVEAEKQHKDKLLKGMLGASKGLVKVSNAFVIPIYLNAVFSSIAKILGDQKAERKAKGIKLNAVTGTMMFVTNLFIIPTYIGTMSKALWSQAKVQKNSDMAQQVMLAQHSLGNIQNDMRRAIFKSVIDQFGGRLKTITSGGAPLDVKLQRNFEELGIQVLNGYGITECSPLVAVNISKQNRYGTVGKALPYCKLKVERDAQSGVGEICVKGDNVMLGYYKDDKATRKVIKKGWFYTGDIGYIDDDDYLFITGRKKNMIVLPSGENVYPEVIENELYRLDYIKDAVVLWDERVQALCAHVYFDPDADSSGFSVDLKTINGTLPPYMRIKKTVVRDTEFEKTSTKKIKRFALKSGGDN